MRGSKFLKKALVGSLVFWECFSGFASTAATLNWGDVESTETCVIEGYRVKRQTDTSSPGIVIDVGDANVMPLYEETLEPDQPYWYSVCAYSTAKIEGPYSAPILYVKQLSEATDVEDPLEELLEETVDENPIDVVDEWSPTGGSGSPVDEWSPIPVGDADDVIGFPVTTSLDDVVFDDPTGGSIMTTGTGKPNLFIDGVNRTEYVFKKGDDWEFSLPSDKVEVGEHTYKFSSGSNIIEKKIVVKGKGIERVLEDGESGVINWTNASYISLEDRLNGGTVGSGRYALRFDASGIPVGGKRIFDLYLSESYDMTKTEDQMLWLKRVGNNTNLDVSFYFKVGPAWYRFNPSVNEDENQIVMATEDYDSLEGTGAVPSDGQRVRLAIFNRDSVVSSGEAFILDDLLGKKIIQIVDLSKYQSSEDVNLEWVPGGEALNGELLLDEYSRPIVYLPCDLSQDYYRGYWDVGFSGLNFENVKEFRTVFNSLNVDSVIGNHIYFKNSDNTWFNMGSRSASYGRNDIILERDDNTMEGDGVDSWSDVIRLRYATRRLNDSPSFADIELKNIGINDNYWWYREE